MRFSGSPSPEQMWWLRQLAIPIWLWAITVSVICLKLVGMTGEDERRKPLILLFSLYAGAFVRRRARAVLRRRYPAFFAEPVANLRVRRASWGLALAFVLLISIDFYSCPHGTLIGVWGVGVAHSELGGSCRNYYNDLESLYLFGNWYFWYQPL
jgi:hypothetical protein